MERQAKSAIHDLVLELRETLEGEIERELGRYGIYAKSDWIPAGELRRLTPKEQEIDRPRIEAAIDLERESGLDRSAAVQAYVRETAYTHMNRLLGLKCMETRGLIEETITTRLIYSERSKRHRDYLDTHPEARRTPDRGLVAMLQEAYAEVSRYVGVVFDPQSEHAVVWPRHTVLKECIDRINALDEEPDAGTGLYADDTVLGWVYQYFQEEEKDRVFRELRTKNKKIGGYDIVPATTIYTEHYMVRFLVENSLGALWMEMYPDSELCEGWDYFVEDPNLQNEDGTRQRGREPRPVVGISLLDPACGSAHFLLYAFDLFAQMYEAEARMVDLPPDRPSIARRILRENLHGIDIDLRSIQLSALNLYMKACTYAGLRLDELQNGEPVHMNLVCADIVLHEGPELAELLQRFQGDPLTQELIETIWQGLQNARELGSLLKVEEQVDEVIARKREAERGTFWEHPEDLWEQWKRDFLAMLKEYVDRAAESFDVNRRMFGQEAIKGVQLLDLLTRRYDVVTTNPPYAGYTGLGEVVKDYIELHYPEGKVDLYSAFIMRCLEVSNHFGKWALVSQQSFMFLPSFTDLRKKLLEESTIERLAHLGPHAFEQISGEKVNTVLLAGQKGRRDPSHCGVYYNLHDASNKVYALRELVNAKRKHVNVFEVDQDAFLGISGAPFQYWTSDKILQILRNSPPLEKFCDVKTGMRLSHKDIWTRLHWEVPQGGNNPRWVPYARGGEFCQWYGNLDWLLDWSQEAQEEYSRKKYHRNQDFYFHEGLTWTDITGRFSLRYLPPGCVFDVGGPSLFPQDLDLYYVLGLLNTRLTDYILSKLNATFHYYVSDVKRLPVCTPDDRSREVIVQLAQSSLSIKRELSKYDLTSPDFENSTFIETFSRTSTSLQVGFLNIIQHLESEELRLLANSAYLEKTVADIYQIQSDEWETISQEQNLPPALHPLLDGYKTALSEVPSAYRELLVSLSPRMLSSEEIADLKNKVQTLYVEQGQGVQEISAALEINPISVIALRREMGLINPDDLQHEVENLLTHRIWELCKRDEDGIIPYAGGLGEPSLLERVRGEIETVFGAENAVSIEAEMDDILGRGGLAGWLENPFFKKHRSQFKRRPILWQITSPDNHFRVLLYYHKLDRDTLPKVRTHYLWPLLERARTQLRAARLQEPPEVKAIAELEETIADLEDCDARLERVIHGTVEVDLPDWATGPYRGGRPPYDPDLDDGVRVNLLPLQAAELLPYKHVV